MHTSAAARHVGQSELLRLNLDLGISNQQPDNDIAKETNLQMPGKNCKNIQQHRGRRRRRHGHRVGSGGSGEGGAVRGGFVGIFWSINLAILICLAHSTNAVPTDSGNIGNSNSNSHSASSTIAMVAVTPSSITSSGGSSSTTTESMAEQQQPQGQCLLDGLWVAETTVHCEKQASCRAIQRTGHCCPDYKCDCEKDGKTYANGDKLVDPATPCTVCYCKGGEIVCSSVTCFRRDDCMPKYVTGRCCPEYDNCPILDNNPSLAAETSSVAPTTTKSVPVAPPAGFNWNITIKEITKPTEIRITDDNHKVKQTIPTRKVANTEAPTTATTTTTATTVDAESTTTTAATAATATTEASATTATAAGVTTAATSATPTTDSPATPTSSLVLSQDTNQKALPVNSSESLKLIASVGYNTLGPQQKPLVTYNADGLKPLAENDPSKVNIKREYTTEGVTGFSAEAMPFGLSSTLVDSGASAAELEPDTAGSDNIYHIISTTEGPSGSSTTERQVSTDGPTPSSEMSSTYGYENSTTEMELSTEGLSAVSSSESPISSSTQIVHHMEEEEVPQVESNPAYPSLPEDDFSLRDVNFPLVELEEIVEADNKEEQRSIITAFERDNKRTKQVTESTLDTSGSGNGSGSGDMELYQPSPSPTDHMQTQGSSLSQVPLMYSAEDISAETRIQNVSDLAKIRRNQSENETSGELESGSGSGSGELREPTTPRASYVPMQDIDELGSGAGQAQSTAQDPKADAESLKLDESQDQSAADGKVTSRAEKSFVEQSGGGAGQRLDRLYLKRIY